MPRVQLARVILTAGAIVLGSGMAPVVAQSRGGFIARLGVDTMHLERFVREGNHASGTIVTHAPVIRIARWSMTYDNRGLPMRYQIDVVDANGGPVLNGYSGTMTFTGDSIIRELYDKGAPVRLATLAPQGANPSPSIPYFGVSYLMYEDAFKAARGRATAAVDSVPSLYLFTMISGQSAPGRSRAWLVGADSSELDYFGVARSGYRFNQAGELLHSDWSGTTYRYQVDRIPEFDIEAVAARWIAAERAGSGPGTISPRDSARGVIDGVEFTFDYSRPAVRGRKIWGDIVPWNKIWRLGADMATHFTTSADIMIGAVRVPAGRYTLWMLPSETAPMLVVSKAVNVFGTNYNPAMDLARIPLRRTKADAHLERLTLAARDGAIWIVWDDTGWSVGVSKAAASH